ncbi:MAG: YbjN domain-containing protein [Alphaproteobacteria bacterium]|nr:YbjN domain-containing protein [Alphaproteobacteria bacterium]
MFLATQNVQNSNPIDILENIFGQKAFEWERRGLNEIVIEVSGKWQDMLLFFAWEERLKCLHMSCLIDIENKLCDKNKMFELLALVNENLWLGHFSYWTEHDMPIFKHSIIVDGNDAAFEEKLAQMVDIALTECEQAYPVFQAVLVQNMDPKRVLFASTNLLQ